MYTTKWSIKFGFRPSGARAHLAVTRHFALSLFVELFASVYRARFFLSETTFGCAGKHIQDGDDGRK